MKHLFLLVGLSFTLSLSAQVDFVSQEFSNGAPFGILRHCVVDMDGDHRDDIVGVTSGRIDFAYQREDGFELRTVLQTVTNIPNWSICAGDIDNNGFNDLMIGGQDNASFLYADANGFEYREVVDPTSIFCQRSTFVDINADGHLDAFVCNDVSTNHPYRNDGEGNMVLDQSFVPTPIGLAGNYVSTWVDYDNDDDLDVYISKCFLPSTSPDDPELINLLYNNDGNGNFTEVAEAAGMQDIAQTWVTLFEDFDLDGDFDAHILNHNNANRLMRNNGDGTFTDVIAGSGLGEAPFNVLEAFTADIDNDGDMDILTDLPQRIYYNNGDMTFTAQTAPFFLGAMGDLNADGFMDVLFADRIHYNLGNDNHWLRVNPVGRISNRNGIGAKMKLYGEWGMQVRELRSSQSWTPMSTLAMHFGIGAATSIDSLVIEWPSGMRSVITDPPIDTALTVDELDCPTEEIMVEVDGPTVFCTGESTTLIAPDGYDYLWSSGQTTQQITVTDPGFYTVIVTDAATGCDRISRVVSIESPSGLDLDIDTPDGTTFCEGTPVRLSIDAGASVTWSTGETTPTIFVRESGEYSVEFLDDCGDLITLGPVTMTAVVAELPDIQNVTVQSGSDVTLQAPGPGAIWWWGDETMGSFILSGVLTLTNVTMDESFYAQRVISLPSGETCASDRVLVTVTVVQGNVGYRDADGDSFGDPLTPVEYTSTDPPAGVVVNNLDCDDTDAFVNPDAVELEYDGKDNDCDPSTLDDDLDSDGIPLLDDCDDRDANVGAAPLWFLDEDGDGFGTLSNSIQSCTRPDGYAEMPEDCDDADASIYPGAAELCDDKDNDCDGQVDENGDFFYYEDNDMDGYGDPATGFASCDSDLSGFVTEGEDCDDTDPDINPAAMEILNNGIDEDCDGMDQTTSTDDNLTLDIEIYPNPAKTEIRVSAVEGSHLTLRLLDMSGRVLQSDSDSDRMDVSALAEGPYLLHVQDSVTKRQLVQKVVIMR